jgi:hypothetical protein
MKYLTTIKRNAYTALFWPVLSAYILYADMRLGDDITVLIPCRNRADYRLGNCINSLKNQDYSEHSVKIVVLDYASEKSYSCKLQDICAQYNVQYEPIYNKQKWSRANCLNIGIRRSNTKYTMISDMDYIFPNEYIRQSITILKKYKYSVVCSVMHDLKENLDGYLKECYSNMSNPNIEYIQQKSILRLPNRYTQYHPSVLCAYTLVYKYVRGYDEYYTVWGYEDEDLIKRFRRIGLSIYTIKDKASYYHQWHPKYEGVSSMHGLQDIIEMNRKHFAETSSAIRNDKNWGM